MAPARIPLDAGFFLLMAMDKPDLLFSVAILTGGQSRRMGQDKAFINLGRLTVLERVINAVNALTDDLFLVTGSPEPYRSFGLPVAPDLIPGKAALGGIYTALSRARYEWVLALACDMPLLEPRALVFQSTFCPQADVVTPWVGASPETLHTFYRKRCLPAIHNRLAANQLKVTGFFAEVRVVYLSAEMLRPFSPQLHCLLNINTPQDLQRAQTILGEG